MQQKFHSQIWNLLKHPADLLTQTPVKFAFAQMANYSSHQLIVDAKSATFVDMFCGDSSLNEQLLAM